MKTKRTYKNLCYLVCDGCTDLPSACFDTVSEVMDFLECSVATVYRSINAGSNIDGFYVVRVIL